MAPLEVAAAGRPTIAYRAGGAVETIIENQTGVFFDEPTHESLADAIVKFEQLSWSQTALRAHAENFSVATFQQNMRAFLQKIGIQTAFCAEEPMHSIVPNHSSPSGSRAIPPRVGALEMLSATGAPHENRNE